MLNLFKQIGYFLLGLTLVITFPIWLLVAWVGALLYGLAELGKGMLEELRH